MSPDGIRPKLDGIQTIKFGTSNLETGQMLPNKVS